MNYLMTSPINHVRCNAYIYTLRILIYGSTVVSAKATDTFGSLLGRSQKTSAVRLEKDHIELRNQADSHVVPLGCSLICETCNEIHIHIA